MTNIVPIQPIISIKISLKRGEVADLLSFGYFKLKPWLFRLFAYLKLRPRRLFSTRWTGPGMDFLDRSISNCGPEPLPDLSLGSLTHPGRSCFPIIRHTNFVQHFLRPEYIVLALWRQISYKVRALRVVSFSKMKIQFQPSRNCSRGSPGS